MNRRNAVLVAALWFSVGSICHAQTLTQIQQKIVSAANGAAGGQDGSDSRSR